MAIVKAMDTVMKMATAKMMDSIMGM
jgi:hypothetical protein